MITPVRWGWPGEKGLEDTNQVRFKDEEVGGEGRRHGKESRAKRRAEPQSMLWEVGPAGGGRDLPSVLDTGREAQVARRTQQDGKGLSHTPLLGTWSKGSESWSGLMTGHDLEETEEKSCPVCVSSPLPAETMTSTHSSSLTPPLGSLWECNMRSPGFQAQPIQCNCLEVGITQAVSQPPWRLSNMQPSWKTNVRHGWPPVFKQRPQLAVPVHRKAIKYSR